VAVPPAAALMPLVKVTAQLRHGLEPDGGDPELLPQLLQLLLQHGTLSPCSQPGARAQLSALLPKHCSERQREKMMA